MSYVHENPVYRLSFLVVHLRAEFFYDQSEHGQGISEEDESHITNSHQQAYHSDGNPRAENTSSMSASQMGSAAAMQVSFTGMNTEVAETHIFTVH